MRLIKKKYMPLALACVLFCSGINVEAGSYSKKKMDEAATEYRQILDVISEDYIGSPVSLEDLIDASYQGIFNVLDDYSVYYTKDEYSQFFMDMQSNTVGIGISIFENEIGQYEIKEVYEGSNAHKAGLIKGDIITKINGQSNKDIALTDVFTLLVGQEGTKVNIEIVREGKILNFSIVRAIFHVPSLKWQDLNTVLKDHKAEGKKAFYAIFSEFSYDVSKDFKLMLEDAKSKSVSHIVLDFRNNPGGSLEEVLLIADMIVPEGPVVHLIDKAEKKITFHSVLKKPTGINFIVLTNKYTASAAELMTSAIKESGIGVSIGTTTYGKGVAQLTYDLAGGRGMKLTVREYLTPKENKVNGVGIKPSIPMDVPDYYFPNSLEEITTNPESLNRLLKYLGYDIKEMLNYGPSTKAAVKKIQMENKLEGTGIMDGDTLLLINMKLNKSIQNNDVVLKRAIEYIGQK